jgi:hypothetical protein
MWRYIAIDRQVHEDRYYHGGSKPVLFPSHPEREASTENEPYWPGKVVSSRLFKQDVFRVGHPAEA